MTFKELNIIEPILKALEEKGYTTPTPIQEKAIIPALTNRDILGLAQTGTGKTAAFSLPIIQQLYLNKVSGKRREIRALILTPTRELAIQINDSLNDYTQYTGLRHCVIYGGVKQKAQTDELKTGIDILVATPGRLLDLINQGFINLTLYVIRP
jgi:Superfamily II DNA and RNA helicases